MTERDYTAFAELYRLNFPEADGPQILEAFARGAVGEISGPMIIVMGVPGEEPDQDDCDVAIEVEYGPQRLRIIAPAAALAPGADNWVKFTRTIPRAKLLGLRPDDFARGFIAKAMIENRQYDLRMGAIVAYAAAWLLRDKPFGHARIVLNHPEPGMIGSTYHLTGDPRTQPGDKQ